MTFDERIIAVSVLTFLHLQITIDIKRHLLLYLHFATYIKSL